MAQGTIDAPKTAANADGLTLARWLEEQQNAPSGALPARRSEPFTFTESEHAEAPVFTPLLHCACTATVSPRLIGPRLLRGNCGSPQG